MKNESIVSSVNDLSFINDFLQTFGIPSIKEGENDIFFLKNGKYELLDFFIMILLHDKGTYQCNLIDCCLITIHNDSENRRTRPCSICE